MKPHIRLEREVFLSWKARYLPGKITSYEKEADRAFSKLSFKRETESGLARKLRTAQIIVFGDDRLVSDDQERIMSLLGSIRLRASKTVLLTNRVGMPETFSKWLEKKKIKVKRIRSRGKSLNLE